MLRTFTTTSLAALVAATLSTGVLAQEYGQRDNARAEQYQTNHSDKTVAEVLESDDRFSKFHKAVKQADLEDELNGDSNYTVFAPTNEAFERLPEGTWDEWMDDDNSDELRDILSYHIVESRISSSDIDEQGSEEGTMSGDNLRLTSSYGRVSVNTASITTADIETENGYIHAIDSVLLNAEHDSNRTVTGR